jgi:hypothetical protein
LRFPIIFQLLSLLIILETQNKLEEEKEKGIQLKKKMKEKDKKINDMTEREQDQKGRSFTLISPTQEIYYHL